MRGFRSTRRAFGARGRARGFSHVSMVMEAAAVMGWFVILVLGEKYLSDGTTARRAAEMAVEQTSVQNAMSFCQGSGAGADSLPGLDAQSSVGAFGNGMPQLSISQIPSIIAGLGIGQLATLPVYFQGFQSSQSSASSGAVKAASPLGYTSGAFQGQRQFACLERSLDSAGAPWINLQAARQSIYTTNIQGY